jgi:hypothetical protein
VKEAMNIFMIESPLQLINAIEAKHHFKIKKEQAVLLILQAENENTMKQIANMVSKDDWADVQVIGSGTGKVTWVTRLLSLRKVIKKYNQADYIFIGDYRSDIMRDYVVSVQHKKVFLLDDGNVTIRMFEMISAGRLPGDSGAKFMLKSALKKVLTPKSPKNNEITNIAFFTSFDLKSDKLEIVKNKYEYFSSLKRNQQRKPVFFFLGAPLSEKNVMHSEDRYIEYLRDVKEYLNGTEMVYIPHRSESPEKLDKIKNELKISVTHINTCIEFELSKNTYLPEGLGSFYSSALGTCHQIFKDLIDIKAFYLLPNDLAEKNQPEIEKIYLYYGEFMEVVRDY